MSEAVQEFLTSWDAAWKFIAFMAGCSLPFAIVLTPPVFLFVWVICAKPAGDGGRAR